eukprot:1547798-Pleurochrysis_carterae.AAC.2
MVDMEHSISILPTAFIQDCGRKKEHILYCNISINYYFWDRNEYACSVERRLQGDGTKPCGVSTKKLSLDAAQEQPLKRNLSREGRSGKTQGWTGEAKDEGGGMVGMDALAREGSSEGKGKRHKVDILDHRNANEEHND